ncbi:MAG: DUF167 domain-containing protein [bacterium]|jgi:uncharacterized protein (TIGR00251 family)|nr:DUF167 domain-containing protein [bacterium]MDD3804729.1 DUF167 domain-containing protein [bacterium]MDD4152195.1 DUF167 domain-containing protein [bacterium]MDD4558351.1 DUF167 domain-containing protein [bacterium]
MSDVLIIDEKDGRLIFEVKIRPRASKDAVEGVRDGRLEIRTTAPPLEGQANERLIRILSKKLGISRSSLEILSGEHSRYKRLAVIGLDRTGLLQRLLS